MVSFFRNVFSSLGWTASLGGKFFTVAPVSTFLVQLFTLASQFLLLAAFFLPLKVMILLGAEVVPRYFPEYLQAYGRESLILLVSALAIVCYALHALMELLVSLFARRGASRLLRRSNKLELFENQATIAVGAYARYSRGVASGIFALLTFLLLLVLYPAIFAIVSLFSCTVLFLMGGLQALFPPLEGLVQKNLSGVLAGISGVGFLLVFVFVVFDFLYLQPPVVFVAIITMLLVRQGFQRLSVFIQDLLFLRGQHRQINALFFHSHPLLLEAPEQGVQAVLASSQREGWVRRVIRELAGVEMDNPVIHWHQLGAAGVSSLEVMDAGGNGYLLKAYDEKRCFLAAHEHSLFREGMDIPSLPFVAGGYVNGIYCTIFAWNGQAKLALREANAAVIEVFTRLLATEPSAELQQRFARSHPFIEQRLSESLIDKVEMAATAPLQLEVVSLFRQRLPELKFAISRLPRQIISTDANLNTVVKGPDGTHLLSHWAGWRLEPVGAGWPVNEREQLRVAFESAKQVRTELVGAPYAHVLLSTLAYAIERCCNQRNYPGALELMTEVVELLEKSETSSRAVGY